MVYFVNDYRNLFKWDVLKTWNKYVADVMLTWNDFTQGFLMKAFKDQNKKIIVYQHGRFATMDYGENGWYKKFFKRDDAVFTGDLFMVWGEHDKEWLMKEAGLKEEQILVTGSMLFDESIKEENRKKIEKKDILTIGFAPMHWEVEELNDNKMAIEAICKSKKKEEKLIIKTMEEIVLNLSDEYIKENNIEIVSTDTKKEPEQHEIAMKKFFDDIDVLFAIDTSTIFLHAHLRGIPVPYMMMYTDRPVHIPKWMNVVYNCTKARPEFDNISLTLEDVRNAKFALPTEEDIRHELKYPAMTNFELDEELSKRYGNNNKVLVYDKSRLNVCFIPIDDSGCGYYRMIQPMKMLNKAMGDKVYAQTTNHMFEELLSNADVVVMQRCYDIDMFFALKHAMKKNAVLVYDVDDNYFDVPNKNSAKKEITHIDSNIAIKTFMRNADCVTAPAPFIVDYYRPYSKRIEMLPNCVDFEAWDKVYEQRMRYSKDRDEHAPNHLGIGFQGGESHHYDMTMITEALRHILRVHQNIFLYTAGMDLREYIEYNEFAGRVIYTGVDWSTRDYGYLIYEFDIGIAPIQDNDFNKCRSPIKFIEYSASGIPFVGSNRPPYTYDVVNKVNGLLVNNPKTDWINALEHMIQHPERRKLYSENARKYVKEKYDAFKNAHMWYDLYKSLYEQKCEARKVVLA